VVRGGWGGFGGVSFPFGLVTGDCNTNIASKKNRNGFVGSLSGRVDSSVKTCRCWCALCSNLLLTQRSSDSISLDKNADPSNERGVFGMGLR